MQQVDPLARTLSIFALLIAGGSLWVSLRTYLRGGARVKVRAAKELSYESGDIFGVGSAIDDVLCVTVSSKGLAKAQVTNVFYEVEKLDPFVLVEPSGPSLPEGIEGMHQAVWVISLSSIVSKAELNG